MYKHLSRPNPSGFAGFLIGSEVVGKGLFELKRNSLSHISNAVDRVYYGLRLGFKEVSPRNFDYNILPSNTNFSGP